MNKSLLTCALLGAAATTAVAATQEKPNIVFILADDLGYGDVNYLNADSKIPTPNIDKLANDGQIYTNAHTSSSVSTPSRYSVITGRYCWRTSLKKGVLVGYSEPLIEKERPTVASMLRDQGYNTACIGKWHLGMSWSSNDGKPVDRFGKNVDFSKGVDNTPIDRGFDYFYGISASLDFSPYLIIEDHKVIDKPSIFYDASNADINPYMAVRHGWAVKDRKPQYFLPKFVDKFKEKVGEYSKQDDPFFIYFALNAPHCPVAPNDKFKGKSGAGDYGDFVVEVDDVVKQVMETLEKNGIADNTLVIFTSDNGPENIAYERAEEYNHFSAGELKGIKRDLWEGGHRVPFIVHWPEGVKEGTRTDYPVCLSDFYATAADIVDYKKSALEAEDSYSLLPLMNGKKKSSRTSVIHHSCQGRFAIRKGDWVLIEDTWGDDNRNPKSKRYFEFRGYEYKQNNGELFNLKDDLREFNNVYDKYPKKVTELKAILDATRGDD